METHKEIQGETPTSTSKTAVGKGRGKKPIQIEEKVVALRFFFNLTLRVSLILGFSSRGGGFFVLV